MAFLEESSIDFSTDTGYDLSDAEITGGSLVFESGLTGTGTCETPDIDTSSVASVNRFSITASESSDFIIRVLASFDSGTTWYRYALNAWIETDESLISTKGMTVQSFEDVRDWPLIGDSVRFLISLTRSSSSSSGSVSQITMYYLSGSTFETASVESEPSSSDTLENAIDIQPDYPVNISFEDSTIQTTSQGGYTVNISQSTSLRRVYSGKFRGLSLSEAQTVESFLIQYQTDAFTWENAPLTDGTMVFQSSQEPSPSLEDLDVYEIPFAFTEVK